MARLEEYLSTCACKDGVIGTPDPLRQRADGTFDLGLALFRVGERFGRRFGEEEIDAGTDSASRVARHAEVECAIRVVVAIAEASEVALTLRAHARYLQGNLAFLDADYEGAVRSYDSSSRSFPRRDGRWRSRWARRPHGTDRLRSAASRTRKTRAMTPDRRPIRRLGRVETAARCEARRAERPATRGRTREGTLAEVTTRDWTAAHDHKHRTPDRSLGKRARLRRRAPTRMTACSTSWNAPTLQQEQAKANGQTGMFVEWLTNEWGMSPPSTRARAARPLRPIDWRSVLALLLGIVAFAPGVRAQSAPQMRISASADVVGVGDTLHVQAGCHELRPLA